MVSFYQYISVQFYVLERTTSVLFLESYPPTSPPSPFNQPLGDEKFANEKYFNGYSNTRSVQDFNLTTSFIQGSPDKHIPSKTSRSVSSVLWITPAIRRKISRKNATHAKVKKTGSAKI